MSAPVPPGAAAGARMSVLALGGIGEVRTGDDLAALVLAAAADDPDGPLRDGDIVVVTSKIVSKSEGRSVPAAERTARVLTESVRTLARRGPTRIVRTPTGLTLAGAGIDSSNVDPARVLLLPVDPDASAARLRTALQQRTGVRLGVVVSDTLGRAWRTGQTDTAIGAAGVVVTQPYAGRRDAYGNDLQVTDVALADEVAAAADLVKTKLGGRPVAVLRGLGHLLTEAPGGARALVREPGSDMFGFGAQEAVLAAVLAATGQPERYAEVLDREPAQRAAAVLAGVAAPDPVLAAFVADLLAVDLGALAGPPSPSSSDPTLGASG